MKPAGTRNMWDSASSLSRCADHGQSKTMTSQRLIPRYADKSEAYPAEVHWGQSFLTKEKSQGTHICRLQAFL